MNRPIKYRAWDIKNKEMVRVVELDFDESGRIEEVNTSTYCWREDWENFIHLMQFTGLEDIDGKEIYFDDIVEFYFDDTKKPMEYYGGTALITDTMTGGAGILFDFAPQNKSKVWAVDQGGVIEDLWEDPQLWRVRVIGNIYQNSEFIKNNEK